ncbi:MAG: hypothetical protein M3O61_05495 [Gemmatimonadota bacterium]|nr:hypothetical protein [Gemmatimonadota bacterium]
MESASRITVQHVQAVHDAAHDREEEAERRDERMPSSAAAMRAQVAVLREVEGFLLQFIPESQRKSYELVVGRGSRT